MDVGYQHSVRDSRAAANGGAGIALGEADDRAMAVSMMRITTSDYDDGERCVEAVQEDEGPASNKLRTTTSPTASKQRACAQRHVIPVERAPGDGCASRPRCSMFDSA